MRIIQLTGSDRRLDIKDGERIIDTPVNFYPSTCSKCNFPDINLTPDPYYILKSRAFTPNEIQLADQGNLLVKERVKRIFELIIPNCCEIHPTFFENTDIQSPWYLVIPKKMIVSGKLKDSVPKCPNCGQPEESHPGTQYIWQIEDIFEEPEHILKSRNWATLGLKWWETWIHRDNFMSISFLQLLKQAKVKGVLQFYQTTKANKEEQEWIKEKLAVLKANFLDEMPYGALSKQDLLWYKNHLKNFPIDKKKEVLLKELELDQKVILPTSIKDFYSRPINKLFGEIADSDKVILIPVDEWDFKSFDNKIVFAYNEFGDSYCFEILKTKEEFKIMIYLHEYEEFEDFANNFIDFIKQLTKTSVT